MSSTPSTSGTYNTSNTPSKTNNEEVISKFLLLTYNPIKELIQNYDNNLVLDDNFIDSFVKEEHRDKLKNTKSDDLVAKYIFNKPEYNISVYVSLVDNSYRFDNTKVPREMYETVNNYISVLLYGVKIIYNTINKVVDNKQLNINQDTLCMYIDKEQTKYLSVIIDIKYKKQKDSKKSKRKSK